PTSGTSTVAFAVPLVPQYDPPTHRRRGMSRTLPFQPLRTVPIRARNGLSKPRSVWLKLKSARRKKSRQPAAAVRPTPPTKPPSSVVLVSLNVLGSPLSVNGGIVTMPRVVVLLDT